MDRKVIIKIRSCYLDCPYYKNWLVYTCSLIPRKLLKKDHYKTDTPDDCPLEKL
jgi:hypothetical protein